MCLCFVPGTLPCTHAFHPSCIDGLRHFGMNNLCPLCRAELPPGPEKLYEEAVLRYGHSIIIITYYTS